MMDPQQVLTSLKQLMENVPDCGSGVAIDQQFLDWYGRIKVLLVSVNPRHEVELDLQQPRLAFPLLRGDAVQQVRMIISNEVKRLEFVLGDQIQPVYGPGAQYDFYRNLKSLIESAERELFLIDPYIDRNSFDLYLGDLDSSVGARVLAHNYASSLEPVIRMLATKHSAIEVRDSDSLHDRVLFVDGTQCWVIGQSIKDAAGKKPTYLAPLPREVVQGKLGFYENIWKDAVSIAP